MSNILTSEHPWVMAAIWVVGFIIGAIIVNFIMRTVLLRIAKRLIETLFKKDSAEIISVIRHLSHIAPALVFSMGVHFVPHLPIELITIIGNVANAFIIFSITLALSDLLNVINHFYQRHSEAKVRPIKGLIQIVKIALFAVSAILILATLIDRSPIILLSGLGAMAAVLILVFQDTLLSFVAGIQISSTDMVRVGDWIEVPNLGADGDVVEIALHTVKVQNWDKTITTVPIRKLVSDSFKNWRGMREAGGRRIKRAIVLDLGSITFLDNEDIAHFREYRLLGDYIARKEKELAEWNKNLDKSANILANQRHLTNIGTFRAYCRAYLAARTDIRKDMTMMVRQMAPSSEGLPLEIYCFTNTTVWTEYETIQSDIFDHLYSIMPEFGLRVFQTPSGADMHKMFHLVEGEAKKPSTKS